MSAETPKISSKSITAEEREWLLSQRDTTPASEVNPGPKRLCKGSWIGGHARDGSGVGGPAGAPEPTRSGGDLYLINSENNITRGQAPAEYPTDGGQGIKLIACKCGTRACKSCGKALAIETKEVLDVKKDLFRVPRMFTFNVDERNFPGGPGEAFDYVMREHLISRAMRALGITRWIWALEFHKGRKENGYRHKGWPHWHVLVDLSERGELNEKDDDSSRVAQLWCKVWKVGAWDDGRKAKKIKDVDHAKNYISWYISKGSEAPIWWGMGKGRRMVQASKAVGALRYRKPKSKRNEPERTKERKERRYIYQMVANCRETTIVLHQEYDRYGDVTKTAYLGILNADRRELAKMALDGKLPLVVASVSTLETDGGETVLHQQRNGFRLYASSSESPLTFVKDLEQLIETVEPGYSKRVYARIREKLAPYEETAAVGAA